MQPLYPKFNIAQVDKTGKGKITGVDAKNPDFPRWEASLEDERCKAILQALYDANAFSPRFALSARAIGRLTGLHHQVIRRLVRGDKRCKAKLKGLVAWLTGGKGQKTRYWLSPEGKKVAELWAKGFSVGKATLTALATDRHRQKVAHPQKVAHQSGTPSENNMPSKDGFNVCSLTAVALSKPVRKPLSPLAERLCRDYRVKWWVAEDLAARYSPLAIEAAIALRERRNGAIYNEAGFIVYLLREGYAQKCAQVWLQARQRPRPTRKPPDEPDWDAIVAALREALTPYGIRVDDEGFAELPNGRLALPPDPSEALDFLRRHGLLAADQPTATDQEPNDAVADPTVLAADDLHDATEPNDWAADDAPKEADANPADYQPDPTDDGDDDDESDDGEPLPPPTCELCGRSEGEPHPALQSWQRNDFLCLSELSDDFKQRFGLPECGLLCRGCYTTLCKTLVPENPSVNANDAPLAADDRHDAPVDATEPTDRAADQDLLDDDGQKDPSSDRQICPSPALDLGFDLKAEGDDEDEKSQRHPTQSFVWRARNGRQWGIEPFGH